MRLRRWFGAAALVWLGLLGAADLAAAQLIKNGDFSQGSGGTPAEWRIDRWDTKPDVTEFLWKGPSGSEPGQAGIRNSKPNDAMVIIVALPP